MILVLKRWNVGFFILFFAAHTLSAQDRLLSQFYASPQLLNPALTGNFDGKYRVGGIYHNQWRGTLEQPLQTTAFGGDLRLDPFSSSFSKDKIGIGIQFMRDNVSNIDFTNTTIAVSGAYHKALDLFNTQYLSLGMTVGLSQRNVNYEFLSFQDQWNGIDGYTLPRQEHLPDNNFGYGDISVGLNYSITPAPATSFFAGISYFHLNKPNISFFKGMNYPITLLDPRLSIQLAAQIPINREHSIMLNPRFLVMQQGPQITANVGTNFRFVIDKTYGTSLHLGSWLRGVRNNNGVSLDGIAFLAGIEYNNVLFGMSYDLNLPSLRDYKVYQNIFEISLIYLGDFDNSEILCPTF